MNTVLIVISYEVVFSFMKRNDSEILMTSSRAE